MPLCPECGAGTYPKGQARGKPRHKCRKKDCGWHGTAVLNDNEGIDRKATAAYLRHLKTRRRFVVTAAQNATPIHKGFFAALRRYCEQNKAELIVIPYRYKNPTSTWSRGAQEDDWWAPELVPYLLDRRIELNKHIMVLGDIKTQPTADAPLQGFETITGALSAIIGHPKLELTTVATPQSMLPKIMTTTGAVTLANYIESKAGKKGEHHHSYAASVVEVDGNAFHLRQLVATRDGSFMDLQHEYAPDGIREIGQVEALVLGDEHIEFADPDVVKATFGRAGIVDTLRPKVLVRHDVHDFFSRNHHHQDEPFINFAKAKTGADDVFAALKATFKHIDATTPAWAQTIFVPSNHPDALARWIKAADWRTDPVNAEFLLKTTLAMLGSTRMDDGGPSTLDPFSYWGRQLLKCRHRFLARDESFMVKGIELGYHGDRGPNGARGSRAAYGRIGVKSVIGHSHSPGIRNGCYQVGTNSRLRLGYNSGPSGWLHTDCIVYPNGKRSLINIIQGKWRAGR